MPKKTIDQKIEELALSIGKGFKELQQNLRDESCGLQAEMQSGFAAVNERLDKIEFRLTGHEQRLSVLEDKMQQIGRKVGFEHRI